MIHFSCMIMCLYSLTASVMILAARCILGPFFGSWYQSLNAFWIVAAALCFFFSSALRFLPSYASMAAIVSLRCVVCVV
jgi:hypothetical protein